MAQCFLTIAMNVFGLLQTHTPRYRPVGGVTNRHRHREAEKVEVVVPKMGTSPSDCQSDRCPFKGGPTHLVSMAGGSGLVGLNSEVFTLDTLMLDASSLTLPNGLRIMAG